MTRKHETVSFDDEPLILVNEADQEVGFETKQRCHEGTGLLHRAFSVFLFDAGGRVLLQQRSAAKRLWPGYWSNACCSHPRRGETVEAAAARRLREELGVEAALTYLFKFRYQAPFDAAGGEHELCYVYAGRLQQPVAANANEIAAIRTVPPEELDRALAEHAAGHTPWLELEWQTMRSAHWAAVEALLPRE